MLGLVVFYLCCCDGLSDHSVKITKSRGNINKHFDRDVSDFIQTEARYKKLTKFRLRLLRRLVGEFEV